MLKLVYIDNNISREIELTNGIFLTIGRSKECDIQLPSKAVSRVHCIICCMNGHVYVEHPQNSVPTNGTTISGRPLQPSEQCEVFAGDIIKCADMNLSIAQVYSDEIGVLSQAANASNDMYGSPSNWRRQPLQPMPYPNSNPIATVYGPPPNWEQQPGIMYHPNSAPLNWQQQPAPMPQPNSVQSNWQQQQPVPMPQNNPVQSNWQQQQAPMPQNNPVQSNWQQQPAPVPQNNPVQANWQPQPAQPLPNSNTNNMAPVYGPPTNWRQPPRPQSVPSNPPQSPYAANHQVPESNPYTRQPLPQCNGNAPMTYGPPPVMPPNRPNGTSIPQNAQRPNAQFNQDPYSWPNDWQKK